MGNGIHTATDVSNALTCLKNQGKTFIGRYFAVTNTWKALTTNEARKISSAGLYIISIWDSFKSNTLFNKSRFRHIKRCSWRMETIKYRWNIIKRREGL